MNVAQKSSNTAISNKAIAEEYVNEVWNNKDLSYIDKYIHSDIVIHSMIGDFHGLDAMRSVVKTWLSGFPDLNVTNTLVTAENDIVCVQWSAHGSHLGDFKGSAPSGKTVAYGGMTVYRIQEDKIVEYWAYLDMQHLMNQIIFLDQKIMK